MMLVQEFIEALDSEINALKKGQGNNSVGIINGKLKKVTAGLYIYDFRLESFLNTVDDTPAAIELGSKEFECTIISVLSPKVQLSVETNLGKVVPAAKIKTNTWYLLERLKNKFEDNLSNDDKFSNSEELFQLQQKSSKQIENNRLKPLFTNNNGFRPNDSQISAIESSTNDFVSLIWGPPGTGKTETIAKSIESHLNHGRKVLLVSHANNAVDQALIKVANQNKGGFYDEGKLVRFGTPKTGLQEKIITEGCELVLIENIIAQRTADLEKEKKELGEKLKQSRIILEKYSEIENLHQALNDLYKAKERLQNKKSDLNKDFNDKKAEITQLERDAIKQKNKLAEAKSAGLLKRTFLRLDPVKIKRSISDINYSLDHKKKRLDKIKSLIANNGKAIRRTQTDIESSQKKLQASLKLAGKSYNQVITEIMSLNSETKTYKNRLSEIEKLLEEVKIKVLSEARLVATTLTKTYLSKELDNINFDVLIVDEASMSPMPMIYWAASKIKKGMTIVGDFKQLPPICVSNDDIARKWLGRSIYQQLSIDSVEKARSHTNLLETQYRMHPDISEIPNKEIYGGLLKDGEKVINNTFEESVSGSSVLCLIDTSLHNPWCSQFESGGRFNLISAILCVRLCEKIAKSLEKDGSIGIITPYSKQASLIQKIIDDTPSISELENIRVNTVHSFQGGDETIIIFDSLEGEGAKKWSLINEYDNKDGARLLLNVALTRAKKKLYIVSNTEYIYENFKEDTLFVKVLKHFASKGRVVNSTELMSDLRDENFEYWIEKLHSLKDRPENLGIQYDDEEFWPSFHNDLANAENEVVIFSPFITKQRFGKLHLIFDQLIAKGINLFLVTLPPDQSPSLMTDAKDVIIKLKEMGVVVKFRSKMHEKIAIVDKNIEWSGSLNIMSHNSKKEYMKRFEGQNSVKELFNKFDLNNLLSDDNINGEPCPLCDRAGLTNFIVSKYSRKWNRSFYGCSGYRDNNCRLTANIRVTSVDQIDISKFELPSKNSGKKSHSAKKKSKSTNTNSQSSSQQSLFDNKNGGKQWESPLCYWSTEKLPGYRYSKKKGAWWKRKEKK